MALAIELIERGPVALVEDEQRPVPEDLADQLIEQAEPRRGGHLRRVDPAQHPRPNSCTRRCSSNRMSSLLAKW